MTCTHAKTIEEVLIHSATAPGEDDQYQTMNWCETCQEGTPLKEE